MFVYFGDKLHLSKVCGKIKSDADHPLNRKGEIFKYRSITQKKSFRLGSLPDCFRLLSSAGHSNVYNMRNATNRKLVEILAHHSTEQEAQSAVTSMTFGRMAGHPRTE